MGVGGMSVGEEEDDGDDDDDDDDDKSMSNGSAVEGVAADAEVGVAGMAYSRLESVFAAPLAIFCLCQSL